MKTFKSILLVVFFVLIWSFVQAKDVYVFWWVGCPYCEKQKESLNQLQTEYDFDIKSLEVYNSKKNAKLMQDFAKAYNTSFNWVPVTLIGEDYVIGYNKAKTKNLLEQRLSEKEYQDPYKILLKQQENNQENNKTKKNVTKEFFWYKINMKNVGWISFGIMLWVIDWINPCVLGVLVFLLTYLVSIWSRKKLLIAWVIFTATTFLFYFLAMLLIHHALFSVTAIMPYISSVKIGIWVLWVLLWLLAIKDYLWYDWGPSLWIPKKFKPIIMYIAQKWTYVSAFVLALFASLVELPCTIWIPLMYVGALGEKANIILALLLYNLFYVIPVLLVILAIYIWFGKIKSWEKEVWIAKEENRRWMKLLAGVVLFVLWIVFILWII